MYGHWLSCPQTEVQQYRGRISTLEGDLKETTEAKQNREKLLEEESSRALKAEVSLAQIYSDIHYMLHTVLSACRNTSCINFDLCVLLYTTAITESAGRSIKETRRGQK